MIGQTTNQANNPPKDGTILPPTIDVDKHELTEQELADMTPMAFPVREHVRSLLADTFMQRYPFYSADA